MALAMSLFIVSILKDHFRWRAANSAGKPVCNRMFRR
jgi:hypothetical protein